MCRYLEAAITKNEGIWAANTEKEEKYFREARITKQRVEKK